MGIFDSKKDIFNKVGVISSFNESNINRNAFNSYGSITNDTNVVDFLLDLSVRLSGTDSLENIFSKVFTTTLNEYDQKIKDLVLNESIDYNSYDDLDQDILVDGIDIPLSKIDDNNQFHTDNTDSLGELLYDSSPDSFDNKMINAIKAPNTDIEFGSNIIRYNQFTDMINVRPTNVTDVRSFYFNYVNNLTKINSKKIIADIFDDIFGNVSKRMNKTKAQINKEETDNLFIKKLMEGKPFELTDADLLFLSNKTNEKYNEVVEIDMGCGVIQNIIEFERIVEMSNIDVNNTEEIENKLNEIFNEVIDVDSSTEKEIKNNIKNSFIKRLIAKFKEFILRNIMFSPEMKLFFFLKAKIDGNLENMLKMSNAEFIKENENLAKCLLGNIDSDINEIIFNHVKNLLIQATKPVIRRILREKTSNYINIIRSLSLF